MRMRADHHSRIRSRDDEPLCYRNSEGYTDPTAFFALCSVMRESKPMKETHAKKEKQRRIRTRVIHYD